MFSKYHKKAVEKKGHRYYLQNVFYSADHKEFVSCNGFILLIEKTDKDFDKNLMFNPVTCQPCEDQEKAGVHIFPDYERLIPDNPEVTFELYKIFTRTVRSKKTPKNVISFRFGEKEIFFNKEIIDTAICFVSETGKYTVHADSDHDTVVLKSNGREAVVMPLNGGIFNGGYLEISSGVEYLPKAEKTKATTIFIAKNKDGEIIGAYSEKKDAETASECGSVIETVFVKKG